VGRARTAGVAICLLMAVAPLSQSQAASAADSDLGRAVGPVPLPRVQPARPGPVPMPKVQPVRPGPVPMPEVGSPERREVGPRWP
jgi:hypothetical protein